MKASSKDESKKVLVAIAWPYVNGDIHLGHIAGYLLPADMFARYKRFCGDDVLMVSGSDCHGTPITVEADKTGIAPAEVIKKYHKHDVDLFKFYGLTYNLYTKTTTENHKQVTQQMFMDLLKNGFISKDVMKQYFSPAENKFLPDRYVEGKCPHCGAEEQRSDQCESCGRWLGEGELINPYSKLTKSPVELKETEHYFLNFDKLAGELKDYVATKKGIWRDWVFAEADGWLREGLQKRAITRDLDWGVELPVKEISKLDKDKQLASYTNKRIYVWFEAVIGYLSAAVEWSQISSKGAPSSSSYDGIYSKYEGQSTDWRDWWLNPQSEHYYFMGQDNLVFHTLMWPGQLIGSNQGYTLPWNVVINRFMNYEGRKFSKSRNWIIDSGAIAEKYGVDTVRYAVGSNLPENKESDFTWKGFVEATNNELVANLGNFINRTLKFFETKMGGSIKGVEADLDEDVKDTIDMQFRESASLFNKAKFVEGIQQIMNLSRFGNQYFDREEIWKTIKTDEAEAKKVMLNLLNIVSALNVLIAPVTPTAAEKLSKMLPIGDGLLEPQVGVNKWKSTFRTEYKLQGPVTVLFTKLDMETVLREKV